MKKNIREIISLKLKEKGELTVKEIQEVIPVSRQAIHKHLKSLIKEGAIDKIGSTRGTKYIASGRTGDVTQHLRRTYENSGLQEDNILESLQLTLKLRKQINTNANEIWAYAFTELLNNAIEHSESKRILIEVKLLRYDLLFHIRDYGIGIFKNIKNKYKLPTIESSIQELLKGKTTTAREGHTGEGIFFTSKCGDKLEILSHHSKVIFDNRVDEVFAGATRFCKGTEVVFTISRNTKKQLKDTFHFYAGEDYDFIFSKTSVKVKLYSQDQNHFISRSIAKRLLTRLDNFEEVIIDFSKVSMIGQGFADEIFRVFRNKHPEIILKAVNTSDGINAMISHVSKQK